MLKAFQNRLQNHFSFLKDASLLVATSGGLDSMVLTDLCRNSALNITLAHCNFGLRSSESDADEAFIKAFSESHNLDVYTTYFETEKIAASN